MMLRTLALAAVLALAALPGRAQDVPLDQATLLETHGDWEVLCFTNAQQLEECFMAQAVDEQNSGRRVLTAMVFKAPDGAGVLRLTVPLGVLLPAALTLGIDGAEVGSIGFVACMPDGCMTQVALDEQVLGSLKAGNEAVVTVFDIDEQPISIPLSLSGFTAAFGAY